MTFAWPWMLLILFVVPLLGIGYRQLLARRTARRTQLAALGLVPAGPPGRGRGARRHVPAGLFLAALTLLLVAMARPETTIGIPKRQGTVVLAFDVSNSMAATDVEPSRMEAAKTAARAFVNKQPSTIKIGVVAFGESGVISQQPTTDRTAALAAIDRLNPQGGTALGRGIQSSLSAIAGKIVQLNNPGETDPSASGDLGYYGSSAVILLSDGENTDGPDPVLAAEQASTAGVKIYPVGLGSAAGTVLQIGGFSVSTKLDEPLLREIATKTDGKYFTAADQASLTKVYSSIDLSWTTTHQHQEVTALFAAAAAGLLLLGAALSIIAYGRVI
jgi:Ca-activated chloride channel family protein